MKVWTCATILVGLAISIALGGWVVMLVAGAIGLGWSYGASAGIYLAINIIASLIQAPMGNTHSRS